MHCELPDWFCRAPDGHAALFVLHFTCGHRQYVCQTGLMSYWRDMLAQRWNLRCHVCKQRPVQCTDVEALPVT